MGFEPEGGGFGIPRWMEMKNPGIGNYCAYREAVKVIEKVTIIKLSYNKQKEVKRI